MSADKPTIFERAMTAMQGVPVKRVPSMLTAGDTVLFYHPATMPELKIEWPSPSGWLIDPFQRRPRYDSIMIVWPKPRRMDCGKWRAAGKVYRTKALAWRGLEKRGLRP